MTPRPLPDDAQRLCDLLHAPPLLVRHLRLVHEVGVQLVAGLKQRFPGLSIDRQAVLFGAATHDLGKVLHPGELTTDPGSLHESDGPTLLERHGVARRLARFARTHGDWNRSGLDDVLVAVADAVWKGERNAELEDRLVSLIAERLGTGRWSVFMAVDAILTSIAEGADERLKWQAGS